MYGTWMRGKTDHPHIRGEHVRPRGQTNSPLGSSPHTWGTHSFGPAVDHVGWIIPTYVGNTSTASSRDSRAADHPHIRGEHMLFGNGHKLEHGSSPHTWGTPVVAVLRDAFRRIIPTYVGNTERVGSLSTIIPGSSPHTWGTQQMRRCGIPEFRIIPTYVGNTASLRAGCSDSPDHPHIRGEHAATLQCQDAYTGSSPHTWGTRVSRNHALKYWRIIPTYVGNTDWP